MSWRHSAATLAVVLFAEALLLEENTQISVRQNATLSVVGQFDGQGRSS